MRIQVGTADYWSCFYAVSELENFFENLAGILENLPDSPLAFWSLIVLVIGALAFLFFVKASVGVKLVVFLLCLFGAAGIVYVTIDHGVEDTQTSMATERNSRNAIETDATSVDEPSLEAETVVVDCNNLDKIPFETWMKRCSKE